MVQLEEQVEILRQKLRDIRARAGKLIARCCAERERGVAFGEDAPALRFTAIAQRVQQSEHELTRFEEQVDQAAAEAEVLRELAAERRGERDRKVAEELAALKAGFTSPLGEIKGIVKEAGHVGQNTRCDIANWGRWLGRSS